MADIEKIILTLTKNKMKVLADYFPSSKGETINADDVMQKLESMGVKVGIKNDVINYICNSTKHMSSVIVADAIPPQVGEDARIEKYIDLKRPKTIEREDGSIDFKNLGEVPFASKGQELYRKIPPTRGKPGMDVLGNEIQGLPGKD